MYANHENRFVYPPFKRALERLFARVNQLVPLEFAALHKRLATLGTDVNARTVCVQMLPHRPVVTEHLVASLVRAGDGATGVRLGPLPLVSGPATGRATRVKITQLATHCNFCVVLLRAFLKPALLGVKLLNERSSAPVSLRTGLRHLLNSNEPEQRGRMHISLCKMN